MLTATLDCFRSPFLAIYDDNAVWVLFTNMSFVGQMVLGQSDGRSFARDTGMLTALRTTTMRVPISRGVDDIAKRSPIGGR